jgi:hypothetical protein
MRALTIAVSLAIFAVSAQYALAASIRSDDAVCEVIKRRVEAAEKPKTASPVSNWWCDFVVDQYQPHAFWVVGLHSGGVLTGSDLMGWYAIRRKDGRVFSWKLTFDGPGKPL